MTSRMLECPSAGSVPFAFEELVGTGCALENMNVRLVLDLDASRLSVERLYVLEADPTAMWGPEDPDLACGGSG